MINDAATHHQRRNRGAHLLAEAKPPPGGSHRGGGLAGLFGKGHLVPGRDIIIRTRVMCSGHVTSRPVAYHVTNSMRIEMQRQSKTPAEPGRPTGACAGAGGWREARG